MSNPVHIVVPGFSAITEFVAPSPQTGNQLINDTCGPDANETCTAACEHRPPSVARMLAIRERDIAHGYFTPHSGQDLHHVFLDATELGGMQVTEVAQGSHLDTIHTALRDACLRGNPCVLDLFNAAALPENEKGVQHHFVAVGGIDTFKGYLIANGDHAPPTFGAVGTYWVSWADLTKAQPVGLLEYHMPAPTPQATSTDKQHAALETILATATNALKG